MRKTLASYVNDFLSRGNETAFAHRRGLRIYHWSYNRVIEKAFQFARELEGRAVEKGDRVLLWAENSPEWIAVFFGCLARGSILVPLDLQSDPGFVSRVQQQVEAKLSVFDSTTREKVKLNLPSICIEELESQLSRHSSEPYPMMDIDQDDTVEIIFTSGTTAEPKGVRITHRNFLVSLVPVEHEVGRYLKYEWIVHPIRFLNLLPLSHVFGQFMGIFAPQFLGGEVFFQKSLNPSQIIETVKRERISVVITVPRILDVLREKIERDYEAHGKLEQLHRAIDSARGRRSLRRWWNFRAIHSMFGWKFWAFISGGATLNPKTEEFWDLLGFAVIQGYGMTETASLISVNYPFSPILGSIGKVMPWQEVKLAADGEILVRGENISPGYWKGEDGLGATDDGWFRTGDIGALDREGNLYFKGRKKEVIVTAAGMKVYPGDIEQVLDRQPEVKASAVVAGGDPDKPEPLAVIILRSQKADVKTIIDRANQSLALHQHIRRWFVWPEDEFPRTPTQKLRKRSIAKRALTALSSSSHPETRPPAGTAHSGTIDEIVSRISKEPLSALDSSSTLGTDLNLDSLGRVELLSEIEDRYQVEIDEASFTEATTLGDIERIIREGTKEEVAPYPYPRWQQRWPLSWLRIALFYLLILPVTRIMGKPTISGREHVRAISGPIVFICNHITIVDQALILLALPGRFRRRMAIAMDGEQLLKRRHPSPRSGVFGRMFNLLQYVLVIFFFNVFSMPQKSGFRRSFTFAGELMDRGYSILVFPEGQRTEDGQMNHFRLGTGLLISKLGAPVIPMRIEGLWELKQAKKRFAKSGEISVVIGEPVHYSPDDEAEQIANDLEERVKALYCDTS
jgi:long-chain acyl-CoA synthetase